MALADAETNMQISLTSGFLLGAHVSEERLECQRNLQPLTNYPMDQRDLEK